MQQCVKVGEIKLKPAIFLAHLSVFFSFFYNYTNRSKQVRVRVSAAHLRASELRDESSWAKIQKYGA